MACRTSVKKCWAPIISVVFALAIIIGIIVGTIWYFVPMSRYPNFSGIDYTLKEAYTGTKFFENFRFSGEISGDNGFAHYTAREDAKDKNLTFITPERADAAGRGSVLVSSYSKFQKGLFIFNVRHTPHGCGVWSQLRLQDVDRFPNHGEITVMDSVHNGTSGNTMGVFVHATHCDMDLPNVWRKGTGRVDGPTSTCSQRLHGMKGCRYIGRNDTFGPQFNEKHGSGGVVALEWRREGVRQWQWHRDNVPQDVLTDSPRPNTWGKPLADFPSTRCTVTKPNLQDLRIVININLCGLRPEHSWPDSGCCLGSSCSKDDETCRRFIAGHPEAMENAYWEFESIKIFDEPPPKKDEV